MHVYIVDPAYSSHIGHAQDYDNNIYDELTRRKCSVKILSNYGAHSNEREIKHIFSRNEYGEVSQKQDKSNYTFSNEIYFNELDDFLSSDEEADKTIFLFFPNVTNFNLGAISNIIEKYTSKYHYKIMFRYPQDFYQSNISKIAIEKINYMGKYLAKIDILTDSHLIQGELIEKFDLAVRQMPFPIKIEENSKKQQRLRTDKITISYLGNPRSEKGFGKIVNFLKYNPIHEYLSEFNFVLQTNNPDETSKHHIKLLSEEIRVNSNIKSLDKRLEANEYIELISQSDIILNLYDNSIYSKRTSGPFLESLLLGKIVLTTDRTWMSEIYKYFGIDLILEDTHPNTIINKILNVRDNFDTYLTKIQTIQRDLLPRHNPGAFVDAFLGDGINEDEFPYGRKAFILYPWGGSVSGRNGAHEILKAQVAYLMTNHETVFVLGQGTEEYRFDGKLMIKSHQSSVNDSSYLKAFIEHYYEPSKYNLETVHIWNFLWPSEDLEFQRKLRHYVKNSTTIFIDYPYFINSIKEMLGDKLILDKIHLFLFDVLYQQSISNKILIEDIKKIEISNIRKIKNVYTYSHDDLKEFSENGIKAKYIDVPILNWNEEYNG